MSNDDPKDPLEGKGEEMIPDRGLPFDDLDENTEITIPLDQDEPELSTGNPSPPETADPPENEEIPPEEDTDQNESPSDSVFPGDLESNHLLDFFNSVEDNYSPVLDDLEYDESSIEETIRSETLRSPYIEETEKKPAETIEANIHYQPEDAVEETDDSKTIEEYKDDDDFGTEGVAPDSFADDVTEEIEEYKDDDVPGTGEIALYPISDENEAGLFGNDEAIFAPPEMEEAIFGTDDDTPFGLDETEVAFLEETNPFGELPEFEAPPKDAPDDGMETVSEEFFESGEIPAEFMDEGMSAGYPPTPDDEIAIPNETVATPEPSAMTGAPLFTPLSFEDPSPVAHIFPGEGLAHNHEHGHPAQPQLVELLVPEGKLKDLWLRADNAQEGINEHISTLTIAQKMLDYIQTARNEMLGGLENYEDAERYINEVEYRITLNKRLKTLSKGFVARLYIYEIGWAIAFLAVLIIPLGSAAFESTLSAGTTKITYMIGSMVWGGLGGVIGALLSLVKHISVEQDFDKQHTWWYIHSPLIGVGIGAVVFLFMHVGLNSIIGPDGEISSPFVIYVFAWLSGYQHNVFTDLVKRMMKTLMGDDHKETDVKDDLPKTKTLIESEK